MSLCGSDLGNFAELGTGGRPRALSNTPPPGLGIMRCHRAIDRIVASEEQVAEDGETGVWITVVLAAA